MAEPYKEGTGWCVRQRHRGEDIFLSGFDSKALAKEAASKAVRQRELDGRPKHKGPDKTTLALALRDFALEHLPSLKGAAQEARRLNRYLMGAEMRLLQVGAAPADSGMHCTVTLSDAEPVRRIPNGLGQHRKALLSRTAGSDRIRDVLAQKKVADITRHDIQRLMNALQSEGMKPATIALERALLRGFFNYQRRQWNWRTDASNPATELTLPKVDNERSRVLSAEEQERLDRAFDDGYNPRLRHVVDLLRETGMRVSEPLLHATWQSVDWVSNVLKLSDSKNGKREVPLSAAAIDALKALKVLDAGEGSGCIVTMSYEAIKAGMRRACERAEIEDLCLHDLRHTAATRLALETGNVFQVKVLTGHKDLKMVERYVNIKADEVARRMRVRARQVPADRVPGGETASAPAEAAVQTFDAAQVQAIVAAAVSSALAALRPVSRVESQVGALVESQVEAQPGARPALRAVAPVPAMPVRSVRDNVTQLRRAA